MRENNSEFSNIRILRQEDSRKIIRMNEAIDIMKTTFSQISRKEAIIPERIALNIVNKKGTMLFMPGYLPKNKALGIKIIGVFPENHLYGIPTISGLIVLNDANTGEVISIIEAQYITCLRTGATSAVATDLLALKDVKEMGIIGAGIQGRSQIEGILEVRNIKNIKIYDSDEDKSIKLAEELNRLKGNRCHFQSVRSSDESVANSEIIVTATTSKTPVFDGGLLKEGTHINAIGSFKPLFRETDDQTIMKSKIFVDSFVHCLQEAGDIIIPLKRGIISKNDICAELGDLILKKKKGRKNRKEITLFKSVGLAVQDIAVAQMVYQEAEKRNLR